MPAITVSRKLGSLGTEIARGVADRLGCRVVQREVINQAASAACCPEVALSFIDDLDLLGLRPSAKEQRAFLESVQAVIERLAQEGDVVIIGRAGQIVLRGRPCVLHVHVWAPTELRISRVTTEKSISPRAARARVVASDRNRSRYLRRHYGVDWENPGLYDLVINTRDVPAAMAMEVIAAAWHRLPEGS